MENTEYNEHKSYTEYLKDSIVNELAELDIGQVENRLIKYEKALNKLDDLKDKCVEIMLKNEADRNDALDWVTKQKSVIKSLSELKSILQTTLKGLRLTEQRDLMKEQQTREDEQEQRAIESKKRLAEAEQKINAVVQEDLTKIIIERQDTEKEFYNKHGHLQNNANVTSNVKLKNYAWSHLVVTL